MPGRDARTLADAVYSILETRGPQSLSAVMEHTKRSAMEVRSALQLECVRGRVLYDLAQDVYRPRQLFPSPIDDTAVRYGSEREAQAHRLLGDGVSGQGDVQLVKIHEVVGEGTEIHGEVLDKAAHRTFSPRFTLDLEGRAKAAWCSCPVFRRSGMREGPCEHMIALRLIYGRQRAGEEALRATPEGRKLIRAETRMYVRRDASGAETVYRLSLDGRVMRVQWGTRTEEARSRRLWFDSDSDARAAYFEQVESLLAEGYIDTDTSVA